MFSGYEAALQGHFSKSWPLFQLMDFDSEDCYIKKLTKGTLFSFAVTDVSFVLTNILLF